MPNPTPPAAVALSVVLLLGACQEPAQPPAPDVLLLVLDCLRADRFGAAKPYHRPTTPHLDRLLAEGVSFTAAFSQASWTRPSLPTILTGLYPTEHGLTAFSPQEGGVEAQTLATEAVTLAESLKDLGYRTALIGEQHQLAPKFGLTQGFDHYNHKGAAAASIHHDFLRWVAADVRRPLFAYLHYLELHWPYCPPESTKGRFTEGYSGLDFCFQWRRLRDDLRSGEVTLSAEERVAMEARYDEELLALDLRLGELVDALRRRDLWDETLVLVTSDHGEEFFEHGGMGHGGSLHDELIAVPLVVKPPQSWGIPGGRKLDVLVELRDLAATVLEATGSAPTGRHAGRSLLPWIRGENGITHRPFVVAEHEDKIAVRTRDRKLIVNRDGSGLELYDLEEDPGETRNVATERGDEVRRLARHLQHWQSQLEPIAGHSRRLDEETVEGLRALGYLQ